MVDVRMQVMEYIVHPTTPLGVRLASIKFLQRVILVHSRGASDPRVCDISSLREGGGVLITHSFTIQMIPISRSAQRTTPSSILLH
jgi:hypothetical protein